MIIIKSHQGTARHVEYAEYETKISVNSNTNYIKNSPLIKNPPCLATSRSADLRKILKNLHSFFGIQINYCPLGLLCGRRLKSDVRLCVRIFCDICLYNLNMGHRNWMLLLTEENQVLILEPSSLNFLQARLYRLFQLFSKTATSPGLVSGGKMRKSDYVDPFPLCKNVQKNIFLETRTLDLRQIDVTEHHFLNSSTQESQGATMPCGCNLV